MGVDKATLQLAGEALWARQLRTLQGISPEEIFVSARTKPAWCPAEIHFVPDESPSRGPLDGLVATLKKVRTTHLVVLAVDLPLMTAAHLQELKAQAQSGCGVVPVRGEFFEPLSALYPATALALALESLASQDVSLQTLIKKLLAAKLLRRHEITDEEQMFYRNANSPAEFSALAQAPANL